MIDDETRAAVARYLTRLARIMSGELRECLRCGAAVSAYRQVGRCVYADPCRHRQWQGKVPLQ